MGVSSYTYLYIYAYIHIYNIHAAKQLLLAIRTGTHNPPNNDTLTDGCVLACLGVYEQQVLGQNDAHDVVAVLVVHRYAAIPVLEDLGQRLCVGKIWVTIMFRPDAL
jgi:hypothetical protein